MERLAAALAGLVAGGCALVAAARPLLTWQAERAPSLLLRRFKSGAAALHCFRAARDALLNHVADSGTEHVPPFLVRQTGSSLFLDARQQRVGVPSDGDCCSQTGL